ncbi:DUF4352 domain-containing protein [Streptomyces sp. NPDC046805]|uniref:DUF4352 domain-containing protein n=1 Tax=Streptomyces sp. NPDC046805 TaxID=3155134 RepID=UPI003410D1EE
MSQSQPQYPPPPQQPGQPQPGWGSPQQGWGVQPQPPKKSGAGKIVGFGCLGVVALFVLLAVMGAVMSGGDGKYDDKGSAPKGAAPTAAASAKNGTAKKSDTSDRSEPAAKAAPVRITAKKTAFSKTILADSGNYTSVALTITNNSRKKVSVNPLYFAITDTDGTKHTAELGVDDKQIATADLAPGENISGTVTGKGRFTPKYVTFTEDLFGDPIRTDVS